MIRLEQDDLNDAEKLAAIATAAGMKPAEFCDRYEYLVSERTSYE
jgi:hypothetical protein